MIKIGYFADGPWGHNAFKILNDDTDVEISFVVVRYDKQDAFLMNLAKNNSIPVLLSPDVNSEEFINEVKNYNVDLFVSMSFNQIFRKRFIDLPSLGTINCHAGKLPLYRGRNILNWALINDEKEFGITVHYVDEGIDTGDIILQRCFPITDDDNYDTLLEVAYVECANILYDAIKEIANGTAKRIPQSSIRSVGMYCGIRQEGDEVLKWNQGSRDIFNFVRAICKPGPGARCKINGTECVINKVQYIKDAPIYKGIPGQVIGKENGELLVKTNDTFVRIIEYVCESTIRVGDRFYV